MTPRVKDNIWSFAVFAAVLAGAFAAVLMCSGCQHATAKTTHDQTAILQARLDQISAANADLQQRIAVVEQANSDARAKAIDAAKNIENARAFLTTTMTTIEQYASAIAQAVPLLDLAHTDVVAIVGDTTTVKTANAAATKDTGVVVVANAAAAATIPTINKNADQLQTERDTEHNTWGNKIERFLKGIFWFVILPGVVIAAIVGTVLSSGPGGLAVIGKIAGGIGHFVLLIFTAGIPHLIHGFFAIGARIGHLHWSKVVAARSVPATAAAAADSRASV